MSVQVIAAILRHERRTTDNARLVLLAIANYADENGEAWPSIKRLAVDCNCGPRTVQRAITALLELGVLEREMQAAADNRIRTDRRPNFYRIVVHRLAERGDTADTPQAERGDTVDTPHGVTRGDSGDVHGVTLLTPKPSLEPSLEKPPSENPPSSSDPREAKAARILAERDLDRTTLIEGQRPIHDRKLWLKTATERRHATHRIDLEAICATHPGWTPELIAAAIEPPERTGKQPLWTPTIVPHSLPLTVSAKFARDLRRNRATKAEPTSGERTA